MQTSVYNTLHDQVEKKFLNGQSLNVLEQQFILVILKNKCKEIESDKNINKS